MAEIVTLTTPITKPNRATVWITALLIRVHPTPTVTVEWVGDDGEPGAATYTTPATGSAPSGQTLITQLNKMNFSGGNPSLVNRMLARLQTDGYIGAGSISGTPD